MQERTCKIHFEPIVLKDDNNQDQCNACFKNECSDRMIKIEKAIILCKNILNKSKGNNEITKIAKTLDLINKYQLNLPKLFYERKDQFNRQLQQAIIMQEVLNQKYKKFNYILKKEYPNNKDCCSFVLNQNSTRLFIGQSFDIKVHEFKNGEVKKQLQTLKQHSDLICLIYMNKSNLLISGIYDTTIVIWNQDQNGSWKLQQILEGHQNPIYCLINNEHEDLLISGSQDASIKFWKKTNMNWSCYQTIQTNFYPFSLSLNKSQTKLISCGCSHQILVMEQKPDQQWIISQTINTNILGQNLLFISDNRFVYQSNQDYLQIYLYDQKKKQYIQDKKQINVQENTGYSSLFPCRYIEQKNIFILNNVKFLNCFRIDEQQNYILQQSINLRTLFGGTISNDGQYIITQQKASYKIEVRELQYLE